MIQRRKKFKAIGCESSLQIGCAAYPCRASSQILRFFLDREMKKIWQQLEMMSLMKKELLLPSPLCSRFYSKDMFV
jgi:hypothetical protein